MRLTRIGGRKDPLGPVLAADHRSPTWSTEVPGELPRAEGDWVAAGRVGRPHGLDGSFYVTRPRAPLLAIGVRLRIAGAEHEIVRRSGTDDAPILRLAGAERREDA